MHLPEIHLLKMHLSRMHLPAMQLLRYIYLDTSKKMG